jgi:hypothetical protein
VKGSPSRLLQNFRFTGFAGIRGIRVIYGGRAAVDAHCPFIIMDLEMVAVLLSSGSIANDFARGNRRMKAHNDNELQNRPNRYF